MSTATTSLAPLPAVPTRGGLPRQDAAAPHAAELVAALLRGAEQTVLITDADLVITHVGGGFAGTLGCTAAAVVGQPLLRVIDFDPVDLGAPYQGAAPGLLGDDPDEAADADDADDADGAEWLTALTRTLSCAGARGRGELVRPDGARLPASLALTAVTAADGTYLGLLAVASDLTEQTTTARRLADSIQHFRAAFEQAPTGMALVSLAAHDLGRILQANDLLCAATGLDPEEDLGLRMADLLHPSERPGHEAYLRRAMEHGETEPAGVERRFLAADGSSWWGRKHTSLLQAGHGGEPKLLIAIQDVTRYHYPR